MHDNRSFSIIKSLLDGLIKKRKQFIYPLIITMENLISLFDEIFGEITIQTQL